MGMVPGHTPRIDGFAGVPIGAIRAAGHMAPGFVPAPSALRAATPEELEARHAAELAAAERRGRLIEQISDCSDAYERLVRAVAADDRPQGVDKTSRGVAAGLDAALKVPAELWSRIYNPSNSLAAGLSEDESRSFAAWFADRARQAGIAADERVPWPTPVRKFGGKLRTEFAGHAIHNAVVYNDGPARAVWRVPRTCVGHVFTLTNAREPLISADGEVFLPLAMVSRFEETRGGRKRVVVPVAAVRFSSQIFVYFAGRLGWS